MEKICGKKDYLKKVEFSRGLLLQGSVYLMKQFICYRKAWRDEIRL